MGNLTKTILIFYEEPYSSVEYEMSAWQMLTVFHAAVVAKQTKRDTQVQYAVLSLSQIKMRHSNLTV